MVLAVRLADVKTGVYGQEMVERLTKADWVSEGLRTLATEGVTGLKVGAMSDRLKVSRGSFYWHFTDIAALRDNLLREWRDAATEQVISRIDADEPADRFRVLMRRAFSSDRTLERAIRSWAATDSDVAVVVAEVDARRIGYISSVMADRGVADALPRASFIYWAFLGQPLIMDTENACLAEGQIDRICKLLSV